MTASLSTPGLRLVSAVACIVLSVLAYGPAQLLPFISDDYTQIDLARRFISPTGLANLAGDALYRCRATSLFLTRGTEFLFGLHPSAYHLTSLGVHVLNCLLIMALGIWKPIGFRMSYIAAVFFAFLEGHHEAVIWYAALPELLVLTFALLCFILWIRWLQSPELSAKLYVASFLAFGLALASKESAVCVTGLLVLSLVLEPKQNWRQWAAIVPFVLASLLYFCFIYAARTGHLHFNDGTFSLSAPFWKTLVYTTGRLLWPWGFAAIAVLGVLKRWQGRFALLLGGWIIVTLLPYSFLTYMTRVPSRHTLLASVALALLLSAAFMASWRFSVARGLRYRYAVATALLSCILHNIGYLWTKKQHQFRERADVTQNVLKLVRSSQGLVKLSCFQHDPRIAYLAVAIEDPGKENRMHVDSARSCEAFDAGNKPTLLREGKIADR